MFKEQIHEFSRFKKALIFLQYIKCLFILDFKLDDETLYFQYNNGKSKESFVLQLSDYPGKYLHF